MDVSIVGTLDASLLGNMLGGKGAIATKAGKWTITGGEGTIRTSPDVWRHCILWVIKEYKNIIKINLDLMVVY